MDIGTLGLVTISDFKAVELAELRLQENGQFVSLEGDNGVGKSTVMDAIEVLFNGGKLPEGLIRKGKKEAEIKAQFSGGYVAKRRIRKSGKGEQKVELSITDKTGAPVASPNKVLKELFSGFITPAKMAHSTGAALHYDVCSMLGVDTLTHEQEIETLERKLTEANAMVKAQGHKEMPSEERPDVPPFDQAYYDRRADQLADMRQLDAKRDILAAEMSQINRQIEALKLQLKDAEERIETIGPLNELEPLEEEVAGMKETRDKRAHAEELIKAWDHFDDWHEGFDSATALATVAKTALGEARGRLFDVYTNADAPANVRVTADRKVLIAEDLWENAAFSDRMKAATLLMLNSLEDGKLPLVFIEHGESLNSSKRLEIAAEAIKHGATVFMEIFKEEKKELVIRMQDGDPLLLGDETLDVIGAPIRDIPKVVAKELANLPSAPENKPIVQLVPDEIAAPLDVPPDVPAGFELSGNGAPDYGAPPEIELF